MNNSLMIKNARFIVTCDDEDNLYENTNILINDGVITYIGKNHCEADETIDASNMIVYPGLINTHHHLYQTFSRNLPQVQDMELFPWLKTLYEIWKNLNEEVVYYSSLTGLGELLKTGCTTCFDHHYVFPNDNGTNLLDSQFEAAKLLGIRMHAARGSMDLGIKDGGLPPNSVVQEVEAILKDSEAAIKKHHNPSLYSMNQIVLAPCSPFSVSGTLMKESAALARKLNVRLHTHLAETKDEEAYTLSTLGLRPLEYMESLGWIGPDVWFAHGIYFNDEELELLAKTKTGVAHCPISNMKLSSGVARIPEMLSLNIPVGLAVDGSASNDGSNLLEEMRVCYLLHRLQSSKKAPSGYDILKMATNGGARLLGRSDIGSLKLNMAADLFMINMNKINLVGTQLDPKSLLSTVGYKGNVDYTIVNGRIVVKEGMLTGADEYSVSEAANKAFTKYLSH